MRSAPSLNTAIIISELTEPKLTLDVTGILGYDPNHDAWYIGAKFPSGVSSYKLWVKHRDNKTWRIYDITTPWVQG